jgi:hypothetical protein
MQGLTTGKPLLLFPLVVSHEVHELGGTDETGYMDRGAMLEKKEFKDVDRFSKVKHIHVPLFTSERTKVLLLCVRPD